MRTDDRHLADGDPARPTPSSGYQDHRPAKPDLTLTITVDIRVDEPAAATNRTGRTGSCANPPPTSCSAAPPTSAHRDVARIRRVAIESTGQFDVDGPFHTTQARRCAAPRQHRPFTMPTHNPEGNVVPELIDTLYPRRCPSTGQTCLLCPGQATLIACLPANAAHNRRHLTEALIAGLDPHVAVPTAALDGGHFLLWRHPDATESAVLLLPTADPDVPVLAWCAGGPVGLLDLEATGEYLHRIAGDDVDRWRSAVAGTPPAVAWWRYVGEHRADPHSYPLTRAVADFQAQPRIAAMLDVPGQAYSGDMYGPGLEALDAGAAEYADYQAGLLTFGDGLISLDGDLLIPALSPALVEQSLAERRLYHRRARHYIQNLDPTVVLAAVCCFR
jgi:hypothetical protein